jgi:RNA polymerase subunit RPABC4/transcription elongation factor Spt4
MSQYRLCQQCQGEVTGDSDYCPHCGILFSLSNDVFCETHQDRSATGVCIICRTLVCENCSKSVNGRKFCLEHKGIEVQQDWAKVFQSTEINDAELIRSVLESVPHRVLVQNFSSIGFSWDGGGDSPQSRSNLNKPAKVFVPIPEYLDARKAIQDWQSAPTGAE